MFLSHYYFFPPPKQSIDLDLTTSTISSDRESPGSSGLLILAEPQKGHSAFAINTPEAALMPLFSACRIMLFHSSGLMGSASHHVHQRPGNFFQHPPHFGSL